MQHSGSRLSVLVVTPVLPFPPRAGNSARIVDFLKQLESRGAHTRVAYIDIVPQDVTETALHLGHRFTVLRFRGTDRRYRFTRAVRRAAKIALERIPFVLRLVETRRPPVAANTPLHAFFDEGVASRLADIVTDERPDIVLFEYAVLGLYAERMRGAARLVLDTHDVLTDRARRIPGMRGSFSLSGGDERRALNAFDAIIAIQHLEAEHFASQAASTVYTVGHRAPIVRDSDEAFLATRGVLFVGSHNAVNVATLRRIQDSIWPHVRRRDPSATLVVAGEVGREVSPQPGVTVAGIVPDLIPLYLKARLVLNPTPFGSGLKIKNVEALGVGRPVVTSTSGAEGLPHDGAGVVVADSDSSLSTEVLSILHHDERAAALREDALRFVQEWNAEQERAFDEVFR